MVYLGNSCSGNHNQPFLWWYGGAQSAHKESCNSNCTIVMERLTTSKETNNKHVCYHTDPISDTFILPRAATTS